MVPSRRALAGMLLGMILASLAVPYAARAESPQVGNLAAVENTDGEGLRLRASIWGRSVRTLPEGTTLSVIDQDTDSSGATWYQVDAGDTLGWVMGTPIPRDYWGMMNQGTPITRSQLQPGDLVFFVNTYKAGLSHGGIYIGNGQFVHAIDEAHGVQISSLYTSYYSSRYYGARRMQ